VTRVAILGWEEGLAGLIHSFVEMQYGYKVALFVHPFDTPPNINPELVMANRVVKNFSFPFEGQFKGVDFISSNDWVKLCLEREIRHMVVAISDNYLRSEIINTAVAFELEVLTIVHASVTIMPEAVIGRGCVLLPKAFVGYRAQLDDGVILNTGASVDHHSRLDSCVSLDPWVSIGGNSRIGRFSKVHMGATIINQIRIGEGSTVGAGSLVIRDVGDFELVYGSPARLISSYK
jgi:sugar O-acyltransferase (sialic acid O-acetyltransferase NeuD family)